MNNLGKIYYYLDYSQICQVMVQKVITTTELVNNINKTIEKNTVYTMKNFGPGNDFSINKRNIEESLFETMDDLLLFLKHNARINFEEGTIITDRAKQE